MKKKMTVTTVILSIIIIVLSYYIYQEYIRPIYLNNKQQEKNISLDQQTDLNLKKTKNQEQIYSIEIEISGKVNSNIAILVSDSIDIPAQEIKLKKGEIDYLYKSDWYSSECNLYFSSKEKLKGNLLVKYRFLGLN